MRRKAPSFLPTTAVIELTYRCNHSCIYCSCPWEADGRGFQRMEELTTLQWKRNISMLCDLGVSSIAFTGGETLLRKDALDILDHASCCSTEHIKTVEDKLESTIAPPDIYLLSNGVHVTDDVLEFCREKNVKLSMSLPGLRTFRQHTGFDHADLVLSRFTRARELGISTTANVTVTALNLFELRETLSAALLAGAGQLLLNRFLPGGRGLSHSAELSLDYQQVRQMLTIADDVLTRAGRSGSVGTELPLCVKQGLELETLNVATKCSAANRFFVVGPSGFVRVCNHSEKRLLSVTEWRGLKHDSYWKSFVMKKYLPGICGECPSRTACDAGCREAAHIVGGNIDSPDPLLESVVMPVGS